MQLQVILQVQMKEARNLKHLMKGKTKTELMENFLGSKNHKMVTSSRSTGLTDISKVFQKMLRDSDEFYIEVDRLYVEKGMYNLQCPGHKQFVDRNMVGDGIFLEIIHQCDVLAIW